VVLGLSGESSGAWIKILSPTTAKPVTVRPGEKVTIKYSYDVTDDPRWSRSVGCTVRVGYRDARSGRHNEIKRTDRTSNRATNATTQITIPKPYRGSFGVKEIYAELRTDLRRPSRDVYGSATQRNALQILPEREHAATISATPRELKQSPGGRSTASLTIRNKGDSCDRFSFHLSRYMRKWTYGFSPSRFTLDRNKSKRVSFSVRSDAGASEGRREIVVQVVSAGASGPVASTSLFVTVKRDAIPDLRIENVRLDRSKYKVGDRMSVTYDLLNSGRKTAPNFWVGLYLGKSPTDLSNRAATFGPYADLGAGATARNIKKGYLIKERDAGYTYAIVRADATELVSEESESNNTGSEKLSIDAPKPDLAIENVRLDRSEYKARDRMTLTYDLLNSGRKEAPNFWVGLYLGKSATDLSNRVATYGPCAGWSAGKAARNIEKEYLLKERDVGYTYAAVRADSTDEVSESDEGNNAARTGPIVISGGRPDYVVEKVLFEDEHHHLPSPIYGDTAIWLCVVTKNIGSGGAARPTKTRFYLSPDRDVTGKGNDILVHAANVPALGCGAQHESEWKKVALPSVAPGEYYLGAIADTEAVASEQDESNNSNTSKSKVAVAKNPRSAKILTVPYYSQDRANWCTITSLAMALKYFGVQKKPWEIAVHHDFSWTMDQPDLLQVFGVPEKCARFSRGMGVPAEIGIHIPVFNQFKDGIVEALTRGNPVWLGLRWAKAAPLEPVDHSVVAVGYDEQHIYVNDPSGALLLNLDKSATKHNRIAYPLLWNDLAGFWPYIYSIEFEGSRPTTPVGSLYVLPWDPESGDENMGLRLGDELRMVWDGSLSFTHGYRYEPAEGATYGRDRDPRNGRAGYNARMSGNLVLDVCAANASSEPLVCRVRLKIWNQNDAYPNSSPSLVFDGQTDSFTLAPRASNVEIVLARSPSSSAEAYYGFHKGLYGCDREDDRANGKDDDSDGLIDEDLPPIVRQYLPLSDLCKSAINGNMRIDLELLGKSESQVSFSPQDRCSFNFTIDPAEFCQPRMVNARKTLEAVPRGRQVIARLDLRNDGNRSDSFRLDKYCTDKQLPVVLWTDPKGDGSLTAGAMLASTKSIDLKPGEVCHLAVVSSAEASRAGEPCDVTVLAISRTDRMRYDGTVFSFTSAGGGQRPLPDLAIAAFSPVTIPDVPRGEVKSLPHNLVIANQGRADASPFEVVGRSEGKILFRRRFEALPAGRSTWAWESVREGLEPGEHVIEVTVDPADEVRESREDNNRAVARVEVPQPPAKPDLVVSNLNANPNPVTKGSSTIISAVVRNLGEADAAPFSVGVKIDGRMELVRFDGLRKGASRGFNFPFRNVKTQPDPHQVEIIADVLGEIREVDETNNTREFALQVAGKPDLIIERLAAADPSGSNARAGGPSIQFVVKNQGGSWAEESKAGLYVNGRFVRQYDIEALASGESSDELTHDVGGISGGSTIRLVARADESHEIDEENESNNEKELVLEMGAPDLKTTHVRARQLGRAPRALVDFRVTNIGKAKTGRRFRVRVEITRRSDGRGRLSRRYHWVRSGLKPGSSKRVRLPLTLPTSVRSGRYYVRAIADTPNRITENNERNNRRGKRFRYRGR